jgi:hypothetical protein
MTYDEIVQGLVAQGVPLEKAQKIAGANIPAPARAAKPSELDAQEQRLEKAEQDDITKVWLTFGGRVWNTSAVTRSKITPGFPDLYLTHGQWKLALWYETKSATGRRSPEQEDFAAEAIAAGHPYGFGTFRDWLQHMDAWLVEPTCRAAFFHAVDVAGFTFHPTTA